MIDISVIIVSWNAREYLLKCLDSLYSSAEALTTEVIVVDNASSDGSPEAVELRFPDVRVIRTGSNLGFAKANNIGIKASTGKYVCLINSDVVLLDGCLQRLYECLEANPAAAVAGPRVLNPDMTLQRSCRKFPAIKNSLISAAGLEKFNFLPHRGLAEAEVISGCFLMALRKAVDEVGVLDESFFFYAEDTDWCKRFHDNGWKLLWCPDARAVHYGGASSSHAPVKFYIEMYKANLIYWKKHKGALSTAAFMAITAAHQLTRMLKGTVIFLFRPEKKDEGAHNIKRSAAFLKWLVSGRGGF